MIEQDRRTVETPAGPSFIGCWQHVDPETCQAFLDFFEAHPESQSAGRAGIGNVDEEIKKSTDILVEPADLQKDTHQFLNRYFEQLHECFQDYCSQWEILKDGFKDRFHIGPFNIQRYETGGHYAGLHSERMSFDTIHRVFAWMTYLNDVEEGGETEFSHYDLKVKPVAGKTLIWPAEWTHAHRGCSVESGRKYIVTGWLHLAPR